MTLENLNTPAATHRIEVGFQDAVGLDLSTIGTGSVRVFNSSGSFDVQPTLVPGSITPATGTPIAATAQFDVPGPFTAADNGCYFVEPVVGGFADDAGNTALAQDRLCDFQILIYDNTLVDKTPVLTSNTSATGFTAFASSDFPERMAHEAFDGILVVDVNDPASHHVWTSDSEVAGAFLGLMMECETEISRLQISSAATNVQGYNPDRYVRTFRLQITTDMGGTWTDHEAFTTPAWSFNQTRNFDFTPVLVDGWRIIVDTNDGNANFVDIVGAKVWGGYTV